MIETFDFNLTQEMIDRGIPCRSSECPLALSILDHPTFRDCQISVTFDLIVMVKPGFYARCATPRRLTVFMLKFDNQDDYTKVEPFEYKLSLMITYPDPNPSFLGPIC